MNRVVVVGSANLDLIVVTQTLPESGQTVLGGSLVRAVGGKGANQAVAAARVGASVTMLGSTGDDEFGAQVRASLAAERVDVGGVLCRPSCPTGVALITVDSAGANTIVVSPGANARLTPADVTAGIGPIGPGDVLLLQLEIPLETCLQAARLGRRSGATVVLNAAPLPGRHDPHLATLLSSADVLVVNEHEARGLLPAARQPSTWPAVAALLRAAGPTSVVITLGPEGAILADEDGTVLLPAFAVEACDTTGAGDAFCGALSAALAAGADLRMSARRGCAAGALATTQIGAQSSLPTARELDRLLGTDVDSESGSPREPAARGRRAAAALPQLDLQ